MRAAAGRSAAYVIVPEDPLPTVASITVSDATLKDAAGVVLKNTWVVPVKCEPLMVTTVPVRPLSGLKELICGAASLRKANPARESYP